MPRKKKAESIATTETPEVVSTATGPMTRADVDLSSITPSADVIIVEDKPRIVGGVCEYCGMGVECIHYPELNGES